MHERDRFGCCLQGGHHPHLQRGQFGDLRQSGPPDFVLLAAERGAGAAFYAPSTLLTSPASKLNFEMDRDTLKQQVSQIESSESASAIGGRQPAFFVPSLLLAIVLWGSNVVHQGSFKSLALTSIALKLTSQNNCGLRLYTVSVRTDICTYFEQTLTH